MTTWLLHYNRFYFSFFLSSSFTPIILNERLSRERNHFEQNSMGKSNEKKHIATMWLCFWHIDITTRHERIVKI